MVDTTLPRLKVPELATLEVGQEAVCFAALKQKDQRRTKYDSPYWHCVFRDRYGSKDLRVWSDSPVFQTMAELEEQQPYRLRIRAKSSQRGVDLALLEIRPVEPDRDAAEGYSFDELIERSDRPSAELWKVLVKNIQDMIEDETIRRVVLLVLESHHEAFCRHQAASNNHHSYTGGLLEHVWSMTRISGFLADHYRKYYPNLDPPLNKSIIVAATVLHDIGKLRELEYHPIEARYTKHGSLIGHVVMGRDMLREAAARVETLDDETLMLLEHAILAHHRLREFGAPVVPQTLEALIVAYVDDLDAKVNLVARELLRAQGNSEFTERLFALDNRRIYRGLRTEQSPTEPPSPA